MFLKIRKHLARWIYKEETFETHFNLPLKYRDSALLAVNERIIELPFIFSHIPTKAPSLKILDFGCARSWLSLSLASLGHRVAGIDLRDYPFHHPNFKFRQGNILELTETGFDAVISLSTLEHVGLNAYGASDDHSQLDQVVQKIYTLLKPGGLLILTLPVGKPSVDAFERSFAPEEVKDLMQEHSLKLDYEHYFRRKDALHWAPCTQAQIHSVANDLHARRMFGSGVNGIGCYVFAKKA
jgi:2-polyprenyl-3-methyl-5-hydroxy-6-metoxy-1,4-benzoquinol methylase